MNKVKDNWYETFFAGINCELWKNAVTAEQTENEVQFLIDALNAKQGDALLDIPCGTGRHSVSLAQKGFNLMSVDISTEFTDALRKQVKELALPVNVIHESILSLDLPGIFDGIYCMGNSFGYFDYDAMKVFVNKMSAALKTRGRFVVNSAMVAESIMPNMHANRVFHISDLTMEIHNNIIADGSYMESHITYIRNGTQERHSFKHYIFTLAEIKRLLASYGLKTIAVYNGLSKEEYKFGDQQMYLVAEKI